MDWKYILSLNPDDLNDDEKDELYSTITWFDCDNANLDNDKYKAFIRACQEILKYKGEQVETLLHELEEMAVKQAEEEAKRQESEADLRSSKSRKSSSIEYENLEQKYAETKAKLKKINKINEKQVTEIDKLNNKVKLLEQENKRLRNELQSRPQDGIDTESDTSETIKDKQKELAETLHNKNRQISSLLRDIEDVEKENAILRDNVVKLKEELSVATREIESTTELLKNKQSTITRNEETIEQLTEQLESTKTELESIRNERTIDQQQSNQTITDLTNKLAQLQQELNTKQEQLLEQATASHEPSVSTQPKEPKDQPDAARTGDKVHSRLAALQMALNDRDGQLAEVRGQLRLAAGDMDEAAEMMAELKALRRRDEERARELDEEAAESRRQASRSHERCRKLQDDLAFVEDSLRIKNDELKEILNKMRDNGQTDLAVNLNKIDELKTDNRLKEKRIIDLVKTANKLQDQCDLLAKENFSLRASLGISEEESVDTSTYNAKYKRLKKEIEHLKHKLSNKEETILQLKTDIHNRRKDEHTDTARNLIEENEALRLGLHEIMETIQNKRTRLDIKSETLEKLLRTLDVKHAAGWYHPAMRLQAELHNLEGVNAELRQQLREARRQSPEIPETESIPQIEETLSENVEDSVDKLLDRTANIDFIRRQVALWLRRAKDESAALREESQSLRREHESVLEKLKILMGETDEEKIRKINEVIATNARLNRQVVHLENERNAASTKIDELQIDANESKRKYEKNLMELRSSNENLTTKLQIVTNTNSTMVAYEVHKRLEEDLNELTAKHRNLLASVRLDDDNKNHQIDALTTTLNCLETDKNELIKQLVALKTEHIASSNRSVDESLEKLAGELSRREIGEQTQRQRADHVTNLYELVKDQLDKAEERFKEINKFNEELVKKNLDLQEQLKSNEEKLCDYIQTTIYNRLVDTNNALLTTQREHIEKIDELSRELDEEKRRKGIEKTWNDDKEQELFNLRHRMVDLIATSDDKVVIAQLSADVLRNRRLAEFYKSNLAALDRDLEAEASARRADRGRFDEARRAFDEREAALTKKIDDLSTLLGRQSLRFYGCAPLASEETRVGNVLMVYRQKYETFRALQKAKELENEARLAKETLDLELEWTERRKGAQSDDHKDDYRNTSNWMQEKKNYQISELRLKRQMEFKELQLQHYVERVRVQDEQLQKLDQELLRAYEADEARPARDVATPTPTPRRPLQRSVSVQAQIESSNAVKLTKELMDLNEELSQRDREIEGLKRKIGEFEATVGAFRKQIADKQSQIGFYERHIVELQNKKDPVQQNQHQNDGAGGDNVGVTNASEEVLVLKTTLKTLQDTVRTKDEEIIKYQTLLKTDRDKHSLAAASLQDELQNLQRQLTDEKQRVKSSEAARPSRAAVEQYVGQVHALERHAAELHTKLTAVEAQLRSSREETGRWRAMANDRLAAMEELRKNLDEQHQLEMDVFKSDVEKLKEIGNDEVNSLRQMVLRQKGELTGRLDSDIQRLIREKDAKIHEMIVKCRQIKSVKKPEPRDLELATKHADSDEVKQTLLRENETLRRKFEQAMNKEKTQREEINNLKFQLMKKPISARSDRSEKSLKEQLQKKIANLEKENGDLRRLIEERTVINETHRIQAGEDFNKWKKMKNLQQTVDKMKNKLKLKDNEFEKLQQTAAAYKLVTERLEREKRNLENRVKNLKSSDADAAETEILKMENRRLSDDIEELKGKMEAQRRHAGALGASMLQEKLEAQERKIAVLELATKGPSELRGELERLHASNSHLQKANVRLEAENLDLKLDLEKCDKEVPSLRRQIQHLEKYVEALKAEKEENVERYNDGREGKKSSELERTVFVLKRVVEKLQIENKRLVNGKRPLIDKSPAMEKLKRDYLRLKEQHAQCSKKTSRLEMRDAESKKSSNREEELSKELDEVKEQLELKSGLLDKVKILLHRAAAKEKSLMQEISELKLQRANVDE
ncbi:unnamed protein product [Phyllotreta striolata]|uniref:Centrosomal protein of 290kDa coiled-coil region domain-containing protein n=1 Tax=Phyllotreta striolata TaxID=444603 RepID=A0A9N9TES2_PHYSR|nr:unnamed protein product [Phyllotreta striolata]